MDTENIMTSLKHCSNLCSNFDFTDLYLKTEKKMGWNLVYQGSFTISLSGSPLNDHGSSKFAGN